MVTVIVWTDKADEDLSQLIEYWSGVSEHSARLQSQRIFDKVDLIQQFPRSGRVVPEMGHPNIREHIVGLYRLVYYIVSKERIDILAIHNSARPMDVNQFN